MTIISRTAACTAVLTAALLFGAAAPGYAQTSRIVAGGGSFVGNNQERRHFALSVVESCSGAVGGSLMAVEPSSRSAVRMDITSYMFVGENLLMAGPITRAVNAPPNFVVGATAFFAVNDGGAADGITGISVLPPFLGNLSIQKIFALIGSGPPPAAFSPLGAGNIRVF